MGLGKAASPCRALCQALEPRLLLAVNPADMIADRLGAALSAVSAEFVAFKAAKKPGRFRSSNKLLHIADNRIAIEAAADDAMTLRTALSALRFRRASVAAHMVSGWLPLGLLDDLAKIPVLKFARPALYTTRAGNTTTQGDSSMRADIARATYGFTGAGVKVGILSDSFDTGPGSYSLDISTGDLPAGVQIVQDSSNGTDEGRAMAQIVHDVAPGASIAFATANGGESAFANNIRALANAGAKVIVDDVVYFVEPMFQDGVIAKAIDEVTAGGAIYFSAAGNEGHDGWAGEWSAGNDYPNRAFSSNPGAPRFGGGTSLDFDTGGTIDDKQAFSLAPNSGLTIAVQWNQPFFSVSGGLGARGDIDVYVLDASTNRVVAGATGDNIGRDAVELVQFSNSSGSSHNYNLMVVDAGGVTPTQIKYVFFGKATFSEFAQPQASTIYGHTNAAGANSVAAASFNQTPAFGFDPPLVDSYSSTGGSPILFNSSGNAIAPLTRQQPKFTAPDGGNNTFFGADSGLDTDGFANFFGTSAAAPHAAAVAALLLSANPTLTPAQVIAAMENTALDMDEPATGPFDTGVDLRTGYGLVQADAAIRSILPGGSISGTTFIDKNGDGVFDSGEDTAAGLTAFLDANNNSAIDISSANGTSSAIQPFGATGLISAPLKISSLSGLIDGLNLSLNLSHSNISQLHATLISPAGTSFPVSLAANGNLVDQPIGGVRGENPNGVWHLQVIDDVPGSGGVLDNWSLNFNTGDISATTDASGQYSFPHLEKGAYTLRAALPQDHVRTNPTSGLYSVALAAGESIDRDFGYFPTRFLGTGGDDQFTLWLDPTHTRLQINDYSVAKSLISVLGFDGGGGNDSMTITLDPTDALHLLLGTTFQSLVVNGGKIQIDALNIPFIDVASSDATLMLSSNQSDRDSLLSEINQVIHSGRNGGGWDGSGIFSSAAAADAEHILSVAAVGSWQLDPDAPTSDVFIKLVRNGDSDMDGDVDADDYARLDAAWADPPLQSSWFSGDFNYNGRLDSDDFFMIDHAFSS